MRLSPIPPLLTFLLALLALAHAQQNRRCLLSPAVGPCDAALPRFYFDPATARCRKFLWGGCAGRVPFRTRRRCRRARCTAPPQPANPCRLKPETGPCRARFIRWFFDPATKRCSSFIWGGCRGVVPFDTRAACERKCPVDDPCLKKPDPGPCKALIPRFWYNPTTRMCERFNYGGCKGVVPFRTRADCNAAKCTCSQTPVAGPCRGAFPKWFFNQDTRRCDTFIYGGCKGSVPFDTENMCLAAGC